MDQKIAKLKVAEGSQEVSLKDLQNILWYKGWKEYFAATEAISRKLDRYRSVSVLPEGTTVEDIKAVSTQLKELSAKLQEAAKQIK